MSLNRAFGIGAAGLTAQRTRMETVASNLANARTTRTPEGGPFRRLLPVFGSKPLEAPIGDRIGRDLRSVEVLRVIADPSPPLLRFEPGHPDSNAEGLVAYPNVDPVKEMVDMLSATRSYEAGVTIVKSVREMSHAALEISA
jgi:flagellar basal-body rod protein FlgC